MDRTSRTGVFVCAALLVICLFLQSTFYPLPKQLPGTKKPAATATTTTPGKTTPTPPTPPPVAEELTVLENSVMKVTLTTNGAAIKKIELLQEKEDAANVILNKNSHSNILALAGWPGADTAVFKLKEHSDDHVTYETTLPGGVTWDRTYAFSPTTDTDSGMSGLLRAFVGKLASSLGQTPPPPLVYTFEVKDSLTNSGATACALPAYSISIGRAQPLRVYGKYQPGPYGYPDFGWFTNHFHRTTIGDFNPGFVPIVGVKTKDGRDAFTSTVEDNAPLKWIGAENQFFTVLLTSTDGHPINHASFQCFNKRDDNGSVPYGTEPEIEATADFPGINVPAGQTVALDYSLYAGPKDFNRLDALGSNQGELMYYDGVLPFSLLIIPMLTVLHFWYVLFHNYGVAIILLTLIIKAITWPLVSVSNRAGKRMQALSPKIKELQEKLKEKYKDQPDKIASETTSGTWALYRDYGVNPAKGCLPVFVQMPVFFSLYFMLQSSVELRGQSFLWVRDLTQPDTILSFVLPFKIPFLGDLVTLNPLPILVTATSAVMMRMTPQIGDPQQAKIAQWMPLIFLVLFYNFASALSLYYVINNCVSILQIYRNLKKPLPVLQLVPRKKKTGARV